MILFFSIDITDFVVSECVREIREENPLATLHGKEEQDVAHNVEVMAWEEEAITTDSNVERNEEEPMKIKSKSSSYQGVNEAKF